jgi:hypothetical protein
MENSFTDWIPAFAGMTYNKQNKAALREIYRIFSFLCQTAPKGKIFRRGYYANDNDKSQKNSKKKK